MDKGSHFKGKGVLEHLFEARKKGFLATKEHHGIEGAGHIIGGADAAKETAIFSLLVWIIVDALHISAKLIPHLLGLLLFGLFLWKVGRSAFLGWSRLERVNILIDDEKKEIEENREEEKAELTEMYKAKGFSGPLLEKVIDTLMADDNKLLGIMLEEELGVSLEAYEHPLKQAFGTGVGVFFASFAILVGLSFSTHYGVYLASYLVIFIASYVMARIENIRILNALVWNLALTFLASTGIYFLSQFVIGS